MVMRTLRNKVSLIIWMSAILLIALVVGLVAPGFMGGDHGLAGAAAVVDGQAIDSQQFSRILDSRLEQARQSQGGDLSDATAARVRKDTLNELISEQLAFAHAKSVGQTMSPEEFRQELLDDPELQDQQGHFDQARYEQILEAQAQQGVPWQQAEENFQRAMLLNKVRAFWNDQAVLTPGERLQAEARFDRQVRAKAVVWNLKALRAGVKISQDDLETYYSLHKQDWVKPEQLELRQIQIRAGFGESTGTAKAKADADWARLEAGASFKTLAAKDNSDEALRKSSGSLGWVAHDDLRHAALADAAFKLKLGSFSKVIPTNDGFTIIKAEGRRPGFEPTFANSKSKAQEALATQRATQQAAALAAQALADLGTGKKSLEAVAKLDHGTVVTTDWFGRDDTKALPALGQNPAFARSLLLLDKGAALSNPVQGKEAVAIAVLLDERPGKAPADVKTADQRNAEALSQAKADKSKALYDAWIAALRAKADIVDQSGALGPQDASSSAPGSDSGSDSN